MANRLIVCLDGTWMRPGQRIGGKISPTNVVKMARAIAPTGPGSPPGSGTVTQTVFYDQGVGSGGGPLMRLLGGVSGIGLNKIIQDSYRFLMLNYEDRDGDPDEIFILGFSRGAYTARSLAGFLRNSGLLKTIHADRLDEAFALYRSESHHPNSREARCFRDDYSREVSIQFLGVWDTVGSLGIPPLGRLTFLDPIVSIFNEPFHFHDVELSSSVKHAYQALAIDERLRPFQPAIWGMVDEDGNYIPGAEPKIVDAESEERQVVEQVWFAGYHGNIGGGFPNTGLSDVAFTWMMEKAHACGLAFDDGYVASTIRPDPLERADELGVRYIELAGTFDRRLGETWPETEAVHPAVIERHKNASPPYDPKNLRKYLDDPDHNVAEVAQSAEKPVPAGLRAAR